jgi:hypothetical protein
MALSIATDNRRQARRFPARHRAKIVLGSEVMISCTVSDISIGGARIALQPEMHLPETFELFIAAHDLQVRRVRMCWRDGDYAGVAFDADESTTTSVVQASRPSPFEVCLEQAATPVHVAGTPTRRQLKLYSTAV